MNLNFGDGDEENHYYKMVKKRIVRKKHGTLDQNGNKIISPRHRSPKELNFNM